MESHLNSLSRAGCRFIQLCEGERAVAHVFIESLRQVSPRDAARVGIWHAFLLVACLWGGMPYLFLQALLAIELILVTLATIPFYPDRSVRSHLLDFLKLSAGLVFAMVFIVASYGVASSGNSNFAIDIQRDLLGIGIADFGWALGYVVIHILVSMRTALSSPNPRLAWTRLNLAEAGSTFVALFLMVFATFFLGLPIVSGLAWLGLVVNVDVVLSTLMIVVRYVLSLIMTLMTDSEMETIARNPYIDR